jgi:hypothetical protein
MTGGRKGGKRGCLFSLSLRERAGVRGSWLRSGARWRCKDTALAWERAALAASLTPALSRREKEQQAYCIPASVSFTTRMALLAAGMPA